METYQTEFLELALEKQALKFGEFTLKSGRISPYFFNMGAFNTGRDLNVLGAAYAQAIVAAGFRFDVLFGPAYKGIPLACATAMKLADSEGADTPLPYAFDRKEKKDHGEGGSIVGAPLKGRVLIIDDVMTAGTAAKQSIDKIKAAGAEVAGVVLALDRQERGTGEEQRSAVQALAEDYGVPVHAMVTLDHIVQYCEQGGQNPDHLEQMKAYRKQYGC